MKHAAKIANIRSLCALRIPGEQLIPALLEALHEVIPSACNLFDWTDPRGNLLTYYFEGPIDSAVARHYFEEFHNRREREVMSAFQQVLDPTVLRGAAELDNARFFRSALYNEIWKPQGLHFRVEAVIHGSRRQPLGSLVLYRGPEHARFDEHEEALLAALVPYIARALEREVALPLDYARRPARRALLSMSMEGELQYVSQDAHRMLLLAHGGITPDAAGRRPGRETNPTLGVLVEQLRRNGGHSPRRARVTIDNVWGRFAFDAETLVPLDPAAPVTVHVTIHHEEPRVLAQRRVIGTLVLSAAQREVCALLHAGYTHGAIARFLSVAPSTVADHVRKIYTRLDVHSVYELRAMLDSMHAAESSR